MFGFFCVRFSLLGGPGARPSRHRDVRRIGAARAARYRARRHPRQVRRDPYRRGGGEVRHVAVVGDVRAGIGHAVVVRVLARGPLVGLHRHGERITRGADERAGRGAAVGHARGSEAEPRHD